MTEDDPQRKKRLGQYFTGVPVARLLAALARAERATSIIDPMVGSGDMIQACLELGARPTAVVGIDLDPKAIAAGRERFERVSEVSLRVGDAFTSQLPDEQFDLVITNPPYIRYQSRSDTGDLTAPGTVEIRRGLLRAIDSRKGIDGTARQALRKAATSYPGTADVAVPAWILSALLVAESGVLAVVVPQAWLSRNYARAIRALLDEAFEVQYVVEDGDASWFADAQVRTHLVVAQRRPVDGPRRGRTRVVKARASRELDSQGRLIGGLSSEQDVAVALSAVSGVARSQVTVGLSAYVEAHAGSDQHLPPTLRHVLGSASIMIRTLESYGWSCGQGMRTGANDFFYVTRTPEGFETAKRWAARTVDVPQGAALPAVRRQSDLSEELHIAPGVLQSHLLDLRGWATVADRDAALREGFDADCWGDRYQIVPGTLETWITEVASAPFSEREPEKRIPDLTAVAPNVRRGRSGEPLGYWYQLPKLALRHRPELLLPRVCGGRPFTYANADRVVVDANFSTLWRASDDALPPAAMFALLNSTWVWAALETSCTVLGGGALKVEATDLRRLPLPDLDDVAINELVRIGKALTSTGDTEVLAEIDWLVLEALGASDAADERRPTLLELAKRALEHRSR